MKVLEGRAPYLFCAKPNVEAAALSMKPLRVGGVNACAGGKGLESALGLAARGSNVQKQIEGGCAFASQRAIPSAQPRFANFAARTRYGQSCRRVLETATSRAAARGSVTAATREYGARFRAAQKTEARRQRRVEIFIHVGLIAFRIQSAAPRRRRRAQARPECANAETEQYKKWISCSPRAKPPATCQQNWQLNFWLGAS